MGWSFSHTNILIQREFIKSHGRIFQKCDLLKSPLWESSAPPRRIDLDFKTYATNWGRVDCTNTKHARKWTQTGVVQTSILYLEAAE